MITYFICSICMNYLSYTQVNIYIKYMQDIDIQVVHAFFLKLHMAYAHFFQYFTK